VNRAVRAAAIGVLVLSPVALSACSAGQVSQTATQQREKAGGGAATGNITVREARLAYPSTRSYASGANALLIVGLVNSGDEGDVLTGVSGSDFDGFVVTPTPATAPTSAALGSPSAAPSSTAAAATSGAGPSSSGSSPTAGASPTNSSGASGTAAPTATGSVTTGQTAAPPSAVGQTITVPADGNVYIGAAQSPAVTLTGLTRPLTPGQHITVDLTFQRAGKVSVVALVDTPSTDSRATPFDFNKSENEEQQGGGSA